MPHAEISLKTLFISLLVLFVAFTTCPAQWQLDFQPLPTKSPKLDSIYQVLEQTQKERIAKIDPKKQKLLHEAILEKYTSPKEKIEKKHLLTDSKIDAYLDAMMAEIFRSNPQLPKSEIRLLLARYPWPNASSLGEGTILLNIGLVPHFQNESQLAFVLCHEIAHYVLNHLDNAINKRIALLESKATQKEMAEIARTEYGARAKALEMLKEISYDTRRHSRLHEAQADSLALDLMLRTKYDASEALKCLGILDNIDALDSTQLNLQSLFGFKEQPFNPAWLRIEQSGFGHAATQSEWDEDSLKTHPDCGHRIALLVPRLEGYKAQGKTLNLQGEAAFSHFAMTCKFEHGRSYLFFDNVGKGIFETILLSQKYPQNAYLHGLLGICLNKLYTAEKNHELGKYVEMPDTELSFNYNQLLNFIQNIKMSELGKVSYYFLKTYSLDAENEYLLYARWGSCKIMGDVEGQTKAQSMYLEKFPKGEFAEIIAQK